MLGQRFRMRANQESFHRVSNGDRSEFPQEMPDPRPLLSPIYSGIAAIAARSKPASAVSRTRQLVPVLKTDGLAHSRTLLG